ncbi:unnamed protein product [Effrenium voratum]|nr:unnamed protein product [Effrenium voratum]
MFEKMRLCGMHAGRGQQRAVRAPTQLWKLDSQVCSGRGAHWCPAQDVGGHRAVGVRRTLLRPGLRGRQVFMSCAWRRGAPSGEASHLRGANGNCLFLSMATQVRKEDVYDLPARSPAWAEALGDLSRWEDLSIRDRASLLRRMAILDEAEFIAEVAALRARGEQLRAPLMWRLEELFTDMAEEFVSSNQTELAANIPGWDRQGLYSRVREVVSSFTLDQKCEFVLLHADEYMQTTGREGNWAGSRDLKSDQRPS